ncbi:MAG: cyclic nucleotide-binding domain-containing protein [Verrucomicrobiales bacterium]|nr:cyclic nucleotide-binding domain-containing protein [Verrucomicrobiales bacterium]
MDSEKPTFLNDPLRNFDIIGHLDDYQFAALKEIVVPRKFKAGEMIVEEGDRSDLLWFLVRGSIEVIKHDKSARNEVSMTRIDERCVFGEISFLHSYSRTASVRALTDCGCVSLSRQDLEKKHPDGKHVLHEMTYQIARINTERILDGDELRLKSLRSETQGLRERISSGKAVLFTVLSVALMGVVGKMLIENNAVLDICILGLALIPFLFFLKNAGKCVEYFGVNGNHFVRSLFEGIIAALLVVGILVGGIFGIAQSGVVENFAFDFKSLIPTVGSGLLTYLIYVLLQELVCRGVVQNSLREFLNDESGWRSVLLTAIIFGLIQIPAGLWAAGTATAGGILFGFFYLRHTNLVGVTIFHYLAGLFGGTALQNLISG